MVNYIMLVLAGIFATVLAASIAWLAISSRSSPAVRKTARIALIVLALTVCVCSAILAFVFLAGGPAAAVSTDTPVDPVQEADRGNFLPAIIFAAALLVFTLIIVVSSIREQRRKS